MCERERDRGVGRYLRARRLKIEWMCVANFCETKWGVY